MSVLGHPLLAAGLELAVREFFPECPVLGAVALARFDEYPMLLSAHLLERVAQHLQIILVRIEDHSIEIELDDGLRAVERRDLTEKLGLRSLGRRAAALLGLRLLVAMYLFLE